MITVAALAAVLLLGATTAQATEVEKDGGVATAIRNLTIGSQTYDVTFPFTSSAAIYPDDPPVFGTNNSTDANRAAEAVVAVLNAEGGIKGVGRSATQASVIFRVPWAIEDLKVPVVDIIVEVLLIWEASPAIPPLPASGECRAIRTSFPGLTTGCLPNSLWWVPEARVIRHRWPMQAVRMTDRPEPL